MCGHRCEAEKALSGLPLALRVGSEGNVSLVQSKPPLRKHEACYRRWGSRQTYLLS